MTNKQCTKCKKKQDIGNFHKRALAKDGLDSWCKTCKKEYRAAYYKNNVDKEQDRSLQKTWSYRGIQLTLNDYENMKWDQQGRCLICDTLSKTLVVDHDHKTGRIRGLLCHSCNIGLGLFKDDITTLTKAIEYLS